MADNVEITPGSGITVRTRENADSSHSQSALVEYDNAAGTDGVRVSEASPMPSRTIKAPITITPTLDTLAYAVEDTLFDAQELANVVAVAGRTATLTRIAVIDDSNQRCGMILYFFDQTVTFGTANAAPSLSDAHAANFLGFVEVTASMYGNLGVGAGVALADVEVNPKDMTPNATSLFVAAFVMGPDGPTYAADALTLKFWFEQ